MGLSTDQVMNALAERYADKEWAFIPQVRDSTGFGASRTADAIAMNLWPSRGMELHGFEVKSFRGDWLKELKDPAKADAIAAFCDRWWLVVGDKEIVQPGELPPTWGLMVPRGRQVIISVDAPALKPQPLDRCFVAAILRRAKECVVPKAQIDDKIQRSYQDGLKRGQDHAKTDLEREKQITNHLRDGIKAFEEASGIHIDKWDAGRIGEAVQTLMRSEGLGTILQDIDGIAARTERLLRVVGMLKGLQRRYVTDGVVVAE